MKRIVNSIIFVLASICCKEINASERPGDSVINSGLRGNSKGGSGVIRNEAVSLLHSVPLRSQVNDNVFVDYGPYINETDSVMRVSLVSTGMSGRRTLVATVVGVSYQEGVDVLTMVIPPKAKFYFSIKDFAEITASIDVGGYRRDLVGLPLAEDFLAPTGSYVGCVMHVFDVGGEYEITSSLSYFYKAGSMSDKSIRIDEFNSRNSGITSGVRPQNPGECTTEKFVFAASR